jgi:hypothetical protein
MTKKTIYILLLLLVCANFALAQAPVDSTKTKTEPKAKMTKSPAGALWRTFVLPGWGQVYNEDYIKAPFFTASAVVLGYLIYDNHVKYMDIKKQTDAMLKTDPLYANKKAEREYYHNNRDLFGLGLLAVYGVAAVDAYTGAHLFDFNVSPDLTLSVRPAYMMGVSVNLKF